MIGVYSRFFWRGGQGLPLCPAPLVKGCTTCVFGSPSNNSTAHAFLILSLGYRVVVCSPKKFQVLPRDVQKPRCNVLLRPVLAEVQ